MGINRTADKRPLLEDAEQNIGNSATVLPQSGSATVIPQTNPARILDLAGGSAAGQTTTITMTVSRIIGAENPNPGFPGPITGVIEFGNGGRFTRIEFDIPVGPFFGNINEASNAVEPQDGIVMVTVPTSTVRAYARYDNLLLAPVLGTNPPMSHAQLSGVPVIGPGGPLLVADPADPNNPAANFIVEAEPLLVKAMAAYFTKTRSKVYKTLNCYIANETNNPAPQPIQIGTPTAAAVAGYPGVNFWALPAFTKRVKILRFPDTTGLNVFLHDGVRPVDFIQIAGGPTAPEFDVVGNQCIIGISSGAATVTMLKLVCEIGI
jgi:hypothetical protein